MTIVGKPEGREGIWLIDTDQAVALVKSVKGKTVHNFMGGGMVALGADWEKSQVLRTIRGPNDGIALIFPPNMTMRHHLVVLTDKRLSFDVGPLDESQMRQPEGVSP